MRHTYDDDRTLSEIMRGPEHERIGRYAAWLATAYLPPNMHAQFMADVQTLIQLAMIAGQRPFIQELQVYRSAVLDKSLSGIKPPFVVTAKDGAAAVGATELDVKVADGVPPRTATEAEAQRGLNDVWPGDKI